MKTLHLFSPGKGKCRLTLLLLFPFLFLRASSLPSEMRGVWMHATQIKTRSDTRRWVERIASANLNAVFILVWYWGGRAYFKSDLAPMAEGIEKGHDPLRAMVELCHKRGIQVHAWFVNGAYGASKPEAILDAHPDWAVDTGGGGPLWYDLGKPEVRRFERRLMIECLTKYDIDGLHFDYIRYGPRDCYCSYCQKTFAARYGFPPLKKEELKRFPVACHVSSNPVVEPTTAEVVVRFSNGTPAVAVNELGRGKVLLLNWHAEDLTPPAVVALVKRALEKWKASRERVYVLNTKENRAVYGNTSSSKAVRSLLRLGLRASPAGESVLEKLKPGDLLVLPGLYLISKSTALEIEKFVRSGGILLVIDGPVRSMNHGSLRRVLGMQKSGRYFSADVVLTASGKSGLVPSSDRKLDLDSVRRRREKWAEFRAWGVTELVKDVMRHAKAIKPKALVSAAVFTPLASARRVFQDWPRWVRERLVDFVVPMAYTMDDRALKLQIAEWKTVDPLKTHARPSIVSPWDTPRFSLLSVC